MACRRDVIQTAGRVHLKMINCLIGKEMSSLHFGLDVFCLFDVRAHRTGTAVEVCTLRQNLGLSLRMGRIHQAQNTTTTFLCLSNNVPYVSTPISSYVYRDLGAGSCRLNSRGVYCTQEVVHIKVTKRIKKKRRNVVFTEC